MVHHEELILLLRLIPDTRIDDDLLAVIDVDLVRDAHLLRVVEVEVVVAQHRLLHQVQPGRRAVSGRGIESSVSVAGKVQ